MIAAEGEGAFCREVERSVRCPFHAACLSAYLKHAPAFCYGMKSLRVRAGSFVEWRGIVVSAA